MADCRTAKDIDLRLTIIAVAEGLATGELIVARLLGPVQFAFPFAKLQVVINPL
jgi:hypothetical protein